MKKLIALALVSVSAVILSACGNSTSKNVSAKSSSTKEVVVALEENAKPLSYTDETGKLVGYEVDVVNELNKLINGYHIKIETVSAEAAEAGLQSGKYNLMGGGLYKTEERAEKFLYPEENTGVSTVEIYKQKNKDNIQGLDDLVGLNIYPVTANGGIYNLLTEYNEKHADHPIKLNLGDSGDIAKRFQAVSEGDYDAIVMSSNFDADNIIKQLNLNVEKADKPVQVNATYFVLNAKQSKLKVAFDKAVKKLKDNGTLDKLSKKWFNQNMFKYKITETE